MDHLNHDIITYIIDILYKEQYNISRLLFVSKQFYKHVDAKYMDSISNDFCDDDIATITKYILSTDSSARQFCAKNIHLKIICSSEQLRGQGLDKYTKRLLDFHLRGKSLRGFLMNGKYIISPVHNQNIDDVRRLRSFIKKYMPEIFNILR